MYEIFEKLLQEKGITPYRLSKDTGISTATLTSWKQGKYNPKPEKLKIIADYLGVSYNYLCGEDESNLSDTKYYINDETASIAQEIFVNKELRGLFNVARNAPPERIKAYYDMIKALEGKENDRE